MARVVEDYVLRYDGRSYNLVLRDLYDAERAARAREEARALALETKLARVRVDLKNVRAESVTVREAYEKAHLALQEQIIALRTRCGGEMLRAERAESERARLTGDVSKWISAGCRESRRADAAEAEVKRLARKLARARNCVAGLADEIARLRAVVARLQEVPLSEEGLDDAALGR